MIESAIMESEVKHTDGMTVKDCIERMQPMKAKIHKKSDEHIQFTCPRCDITTSIECNMIIKFKYCNTCGQRLTYDE